MTSGSSGSCEANGVRIHYTRTGGAKPPLVMLHGLIGSGACWAPIARGLEDDFDVIMPDARGHGASSAPARGYGYDDHANDVEHVIRSLGLARPALLGHSMGGMTAAVVASRGAVALRALLLVDPTFLEPARQREVHTSDVAEQHRSALALSRAELIAQGRARHPHRSDEVIGLQADARLHTSPAAFDVLTPPNPDYRELIAAIETPTLLVIGESTVVTMEMATELRELNAHLHVERITDAGHGLPFDHPERLADIVSAFLHAA